MKRAQLLCLVFLGCAALNAQVITFSHEQLIDYTKNNPFDRSADGRPKVPDELLKKLEGVSAEEVWTILNRHHYVNQFEGHWQILHPDKRLVGRAVTAQFMPFREDVQSVAEEKANTGELKRNANQRVIDSLQNGDVIVVDLYGKEEGGTYVGDNLATAINVFTQKSARVDGAVRDLGSISEKGMPVYVRGSQPTPIACRLLTGVNVPIRIPGRLVMSAWRV